MTKNRLPVQPNATERNALLVVIALLRRAERARRDSGGLRCLPTLLHYATGKRPPEGSCPLCEAQAAEQRQRRPIDTTYRCACGCTFD